MALEPRDLDPMLALINRSVAATTKGYVVALLDQVAPFGRLPSAAEGLLQHDPFFVGCAHDRIIFNQHEIADAMGFLFGRPDGTWREWEAGWPLLLLETRSDEAGRSGYHSGAAVSASTVASIEAAVDAYRRSGLFPLVRSGTRRLAVSASCRGSSSISSLPGYSLVERPDPALVAVPDAFVNGLLHESVHGVLFLAECLVGRPLVSGGACPVTSPWTGRELDAYQFAQAVVVWHVLAKFWSQTTPHAEHCRLALSGFASPDCAHSIEAIAEFLEPTTLDLLRMMHNQTTLLEVKAREFSSAIPNCASR